MLLLKKKYSFLLLNCTVYLVCCGVLCGKLLVAAAACWHQPPFLSPPTLSVAGLVSRILAVVQGSQLSLQLSVPAAQLQVPRDKLHVP